MCVSAFFSVVRTIVRAASQLKLVFIRSFSWTPPHWSPILVQVGMLVVDHVGQSLVAKRQATSRRVCDPAVYFYQCLTNLGRIYT